MRNGICSFSEQFVDKYYTPKNSKLAKISSLKFMLKSHISLNTWLISTNEGSKFKFDPLESKDSYMLWINAINFKLRLITSVYVFEIPGSVTLEQFTVNIFLTITASSTIQTVLESTWNEKN